MTKRIIRLLLTGLLIFGVYTETGPWTALFAALMTIGLEATQYQLDIIHRRDAETIGDLEHDVKTALEQMGKMVRTGKL